MSGFFLFLFWLFLFPAFTVKKTDPGDNPKRYDAEIRKMYSDIYADSVMKTLSLDEKIAQLIILDVYPNKNETYYKLLISG
jgi:hypothetical protein